MTSKQKQNLIWTIVVVAAVVLILRIVGVI